MTDTDKKAIEEMAKVLCPNVLTEYCASGNCTNPNCLVNAKALEILYKAGYRKQSEGEWLPDMEWFDEEEGISSKAGFYQTGWKCSLCGRNEREKEPYCNCGAKMKGV